MSVQVGDILRVAVTFLWDDLFQMVNVWHLEVDDLGTTGSDDDVMQALEAIFLDFYRDGASSWQNNLSGESLSGVNVRKNELLPRINFSYAATAAGDPLPLQTSPMIQFHSGTPRHGSRIYLPPFGEALNNNGVISTSGLTFLATLAAEVLAGFTDPLDNFECRRVAYSYSEDVVRSLTTAFVPTIFRTQRRRRQGVGS